MIIKGIDAQLWAERYLTSYLCRCNGECNYIRIDKRLIMADLLLDEVRPLGALEEISSGLRCPVHNAQSGGHPNSSHMYGRVEDRYTGTITLADAYTLLKDLGAYKGIGLYIGKNHKPFVHMEIRETERVWGRIDGIYISGMKGINAVLEEERRRSE